MPAFFIGLILLLLSIPKSVEGQHAPVTLPGTESHSFYSELLQQGLELYVRLPWSYGEGEKEYRVLFCLDGNRSFPLWSTAASILETPGFGAEESLIVGIGYQVDEDRLLGLADWAIWRTRDLTPVKRVSVEEAWEELFQYEEAYSEQHADLPVKLLLTAASLESERTISGVWEIADRLTARGYPGLDVRVKIFEGETHSTSYPPFINDTLKELVGGY